MKSKDYILIPDKNRLGILELEIDDELNNNGDIGVSISAEIKPLHEHVQRILESK